VHARELVDQDGILADNLGDDPASIVARVNTAADFIIANSDTTHRLYYKEGCSFRLYNCIDIDDFDIENEIVPGRLKVGIISSNQPKKGIEHFINLAVLARAQSTLEFVVIGPLTSHIETLADRITRAGEPINLRFA